MKTLLTTIAGGAALLAAGAVIQYTREIIALERAEAAYEREAARHRHPAAYAKLDEINVQTKTPPFLVNVDDYKPGGRFDA